MRNKRIYLFGPITATGPILCGIAHLWTVTGTDALSHRHESITARRYIFFIYVSELPSIYITPDIIINIITACNYMPINWKSLLHFHEI